MRIDDLLLQSYFVKKAKVSTERAVCGGGGGGFSNVLMAENKFRVSLVLLILSLCHWVFGKQKNIHIFITF